MLIPCPGGKRRLSLDIYGLLEPAIRPDWEWRIPFFGGGAPFWQIRRKVRKVWINDKDRGIASLWTALLRWPEQFRQELLKKYFWLCHDPTRLQTLLRAPVQGDTLVTGTNTAIGAIFAFSGVRTSKCGYLGRFASGAKEKRHSAKSPSGMLRHATEAHRRLSAVRVRQNRCTHHDFEQLFEDPGDAYYYLDPPYVGVDRLYPVTMTEADHRRLATCLRRETRPWVLSYDDHLLVRELYQGWAEIISVKNVSYLANTRGGRRRTNKELLICPTFLTEW